MTFRSYGTAATLAAAAGLALLAPPAAALQDTAGPATAVVAEIEEVPCDITAPPSDRVVCFYGWVPMSYGDAAADGTVPQDAPRIGVHLTLLQNFQRDPEPNPLVILAGGPGQAASDLIAQFGDALELRRSRSILLFDQRGTGRSVPNLSCPNASSSELDGYPYNDPTFYPDRELVERLGACREDFVGQGIDLAAFDSRTIARDLQAVRRGLGLAQWNLLGTSYGTRVALDAMRVDPEGIRAVVLNSVLPTTTQFDLHHVRARADLLEQMLTDCAADEACSQTFPHLRDDLQALAAHLHDGPILVQLREPETGRIKRVPIGWEEMTDILAMHLAFTPSASHVPLFLSEIAGIAAGRLSLNSDEVERIFSPGLANIGDSLAIGMHLSVKCREDFPAIDRPALDRYLQDNPFYYPNPDLYHIYEVICPLWNVGDAVADFADPVESSIPTLILAGDADPLTPIAWAHQAAAHLPNSQFLSFRGAAHDIHGTIPCGRVVVANFLDAPDAAVDASCAADVRPTFVLEQN